MILNQRVPRPACPFTQDLADGNRYYKFVIYYLRNFVKFVQKGGKLEDYNDMPQEIRAKLYAKVASDAQTKTIKLGFFFNKTNNCE
jgi:hypothetical protein